MDLRDSCRYAEGRRCAQEPALTTGVVQLTKTCKSLPFFCKPCLATDAETGITLPPTCQGLLTLVTRMVASAPRAWWKQSISFKGKSQTASLHRQPDTRTRRLQVWIKAPSLPPSLPTASCHTAQMHACISLLGP